MSGAPWKVKKSPKPGVDDEWPEALVMLSLDTQRPKGEEIVVRPSRVFLRKGHRLVWIVNASDGDEVVVEFKADEVVVRPRPGEEYWREVLPNAKMRGPFAALATGDPTGSYKTKGADEIETGPAVRTGWYSYNVIWVHEGKRFELDPMVMVMERVD